MNNLKYKNYYIISRVNFLITKPLRSNKKNIIVQILIKSCGFKFFTNLDSVSISI